MKFLWSDMSSTFIKTYPELDWLGRADKYEDDIFEIINHIKIFDKFSRDEVQALCRFMHCYAAPRDFLLLKEGDSGDYLLLILTGKVEVTKIIPGGISKKLADVGVGDTLGEMSMIDGQPRFATCTTSIPTDFAVLTRDAFNNVLIQMPRLGNKLLLTLLQATTWRLRETSERLMPEVVPSKHGTSI